MAVVIERKPESRRPAGPEPLRRTRVQPVSSSPRRRRILHYALLFVTLVLVVDALVGDGGLLDRLRARRDYRELSDSVEALRAENARLRQDVKRYRDDPAAIESLAREELGLLKPGEVLFIIRDARPFDQAQGGAGARR
jgi:cell division protein FtsB